MAALRSAPPLLIACRKFALVACFPASACPRAARVDGCCPRGSGQCRLQCPSAVNPFPISPTMSGHVLPGVGTTFTGASWAMEYRADRHRYRRRRLLPPTRCGPVPLSAAHSTLATAARTRRLVPDGDECDHRHARNVWSISQRRLWRVEFAPRRDRDEHGNVGQTLNWRIPPGFRQFVRPGPVRTAVQQYRVQSGHVHRQWQLAQLVRCSERWQLPECHCRREWRDHRLDRLPGRQRSVVRLPDRRRLRRRRQFLNRRRFSAWRVGLRRDWRCNAACASGRFDR